MKQDSQIWLDRLQNIIDLVTDPIFVKDNDHRITLANDAFLELFETSLKCTSQLIRRPNSATVFANTVWKNTFPIRMGRMTVMPQKVITGIEIRLNAQNGATASVPTSRTLRTRDRMISIQMCNVMHNPPAWCANH